MAESQPIPTNPRFKNLTGQRFAALVVVAYCGKIQKSNQSVWRCRCDCGKESVVRCSNLKSGNTRSCGCLQSAVRGKASITHGSRRTPEYGVWNAMVSRCTRSYMRGYADYGGRGIRVCERWRTSFAAFLEDMGRRPSPKHQLDRINNDGDYEPGNCRWATKREQMFNRRDNRRITHDGITLCLTEWSERTGIKVGVIWSRLDRGKTVAEALSTK